MVTGGGEWCQAPLKQTKATLSSKGWWSGIASSEFLKDQDQEIFKSKEVNGVDA